MSELEPTELGRAVQTLRGGGIVAAATESYFGLLVDAKNTTALDRLFELKGRSATKGVALMVPGIDEWLRWVREPSALALLLARTFWPGPLTIASSPRGKVDQRLIVDETLGVRQPGICVAAEVTAAFGTAVTATSANLAGEPPLTTADGVARALGARANALCILPGTCPGGAPSTVVQVDATSFRVCRTGAIDEGALASVAEGWSPT